MAYTNNELAKEFWMLTKGILQDSKVDTDEAQVLKRWIEEHGLTDTFSLIVKRLDQFLADGFIDQFESKTLLDSFGTILSHLRNTP